VSREPGLIALTFELVIVQNEPAAPVLSHGRQE
jgi:hypothetical protein